MSKTILSIAAAVLLSMVATSAQADERISSSTLDAMGLSGLVVMSDSDALSVRGMGFTGDHDSKKSAHHKKKQARKSSAKASGRSWAEVDFDAEDDGWEVEAEAGTHNKYDAKGTYEASGDNFSEAKLTKSWRTSVDYSDGTSSAETTTFSVHVEAGGFSSSKAF